MQTVADIASQRRDAILDAAITVFSRLGYKKTTVDDLAQAAEISKQGLYLYFASKEAVFAAAMHKYLAGAMAQVDAALARPEASLFQRVTGAMDAWFGQHLTLFTPATRDLIEASKQVPGEEFERYKTLFRAKLARALAESVEFRRAKNVCSPKEVAQVLDQFGLIWKDGGDTRETFMKKVAVCVRVCCQIED
ncbi:MAG TPA: TetR/AcrR family transcriptional regulator [Rhizomicrobium sp.]|jgi:AcrR family transcriptional regulator